MSILAALIAVFAWYTHWAAWVSIALCAGVSPPGAVSLTDTFVTMWTNPMTMTLVANGLSKFGNAGFAGEFVAALWVTEMCVHLFFPCRAGVVRASAPFCEASNSWAQRVQVSIDFEYIRDPDIVRNALAADPAQVTSLLVPRRDEAVDGFAELTLFSCHGVGCYATIKNYLPMAPEEVPLPHVKDLSDAFPDKFEYFCEEHEPVVDLVWLPGVDADELVQHWNDEAQLADS
jgi:hypothetical protein